MSRGVTVLSREDITPDICKWLKVKRTTFEGPSGSPIVWEFIERTTKIAEVDGAAVFAKAVSKTAAPQVIIIAQYRVPVESYVLELPAGLADEGEDMAAVAVRELKEETGYVGTASQVSVATHGEPGIANNSLKIVTVDVDLDDPVNANPQSAHEAGELIEVFLLPLETLHDSVVSLALEHNFVIDSRLYMLALGVQQGIVFASSVTAPPAAVSNEVSVGSSSDALALVGDNAIASTSNSDAIKEAASSAAPKGLGGSGGLLATGKGQRGAPRKARSKGKGKQAAKEVVINEQELMALLGSGQVELVNFGKADDDDGWEEVDVTVERGRTEKGKAPMLAFEVEEPGQKGDDEPSLWKMISEVVGDVDTSVLITAGAAIGVCALSIAVLAIRSSLRSSSSK